MGGGKSKTSELRIRINVVSRERPCWQRVNFFKALTAYVAVATSPVQSVLFLNVSTTKLAALVTVVMMAAVVIILENMVN